MIKNKQIADILEETANLMDLKNNNRFRIRSYRSAARLIRNMNDPVTEILENQGIEGLRELPGIGKRIGSSIREITETGHLQLIDKLESQLTPERVLSRVPGVGNTLADRIYSELDIETLPDLEMAAHDGRLEMINGLGRTKIEGIRNALAGMLSRKGLSVYQKKLNRNAKAKEPGVDLILDLDKKFRRKAAKGELRKIAPKRFNPERKKWLPVWNTKRNGYHFTFLFSNTARAHDLDKVKDWVVMYYDTGRNEGQNTIITSGHGALEGKRIIRGREDECYRYYYK
jgi:DNA polymerase (family 10)